MAYFLYIQGRQNRTYKEILTRSMADITKSRPSAPPAAHTHTITGKRQRPRPKRSQVSQIHARITHGRAANERQNVWKGSKQGRKARMSPRWPPEHSMRACHGQTASSNAPLMHALKLCSEPRHLRTRRERVSCRGAWGSHGTLRGTGHLSPTRVIVRPWF